MSDWIPPAEWETIVRNVPIVSVDLVVRSPDGVVLGKRVNEPAKGEWFVPGGRLHKHERLNEAVHRLAREELGVDDVTIEESLGAYEHLYDTSDVDDGSGKHYLANGFLVETDLGVAEMTLDDQHGAVSAFGPDEFPDLHEYTTAYLRDA
ncbi:GDP-mannose mannosyl hydrolase, partial [Haloarchaeobius salinus]|uniref:GDP-mannose mannosyl hydrolase n=1 Tax=Haloarchaeobius salinus TaxID=1198298 RepID=UPI00210865B2